MSGSGWELVALGEEGLTLRVLRACAAEELMRDLLPSKAVVGRVCARGQLSCGGHPVPRTARLFPGDELALAFARHEPSSPSQEGEPPSLVYRDPLLLAADKPAGLLVHGDGTGADTLAARVQAQLTREGSGAVPRAVQRLDVDTTGLVLFSLTEEFQPALDAQVAGHAMHKRYLAVIEGRLPRMHRDEGDWGVLDLPLGRDRHDAARMRVARTGKPACTRVRELAHRQGRTLLLVELVTGRRHQIRVHLAHVGRPLVGDALYGGRPHDAGLMLHAWQEQIIQPVTGRTLALSTAVPARFCGFFPDIEMVLADYRVR